MTRQKSPAKPQPPMAQALAEARGLWLHLWQRELPPIALLGAAALMLRNVSPKALVNTVAPALVAMADLAEEETQLELRNCAEQGRPYTFENWLANFRFEPFGYDQPDIWKPFSYGLDEMPGDGDFVTFREHIMGDSRNVGMLLWLVLHMVFDAVARRELAIDDPDAGNRWLTALVPRDWDVVPPRMHHRHCDAVGMVLAYLYSRAREAWREPSGSAPEHPDLTERFLMPPLQPFIMDGK
jgi:hypothetical protein